MYHFFCCLNISNMDTMQALSDIAFRIPCFIYIGPCFPEQGTVEVEIICREYDVKFVENRLAESV